MHGSTVPCHWIYCTCSYRIGSSLFSHTFTHIIIMLCCSTLKIHLLYSVLCSRTRIVRISYMHVTDSFIKTVLLECVNEWYHVYHYALAGDCFIRVYRSYRSISIVHCNLLLLVLILQFSIMLAVYA